MMKDECYRVGCQDPRKNLEGFRIDENILAYCRAPDCRQSYLVLYQLSITAKNSISLVQITIYEYTFLLLGKQRFRRTKGIVFGQSIYHTGIARNVHSGFSRSWRKGTHHHKARWTIRGKIQ